MRVRIAHLLPRSAVNGPGERFVLWAQGCPLACPGCWNPDTWPFDAGDTWDADALADRILATPGIEGVTFTGGEPFAQPRPLARIAARVRRSGLSVFIFTGYDLDELRGRAQRELLAHADVVVAGRYLENRRAEGLPWRGSTNQRVHFLTDRYSPSDQTDAPEVEFHVRPDGTVTVTGFPVSRSWSEQI